MKYYGIIFGTERFTTKPAKRMTKLINHRHYILPNGIEGHLYAKWDRASRLLKVIVRINDDGTCQLENRVILNSELAQCQIVPKGQESFDVEWGREAA
jgi:hypothetical protein